MRLVTIASDIGAAYAAQMKGVLYRSLPPGSVVDLTHDLTPHAVREAAFLVRAMGATFPAGTVHLVVVDPGVGSARAPLAIRCVDGSSLVGPDNGVLYPLADRLGFGRAVRLERDRVTGAPRVGATFDGRDLFAPAAAKLALGTPIEELGVAWEPLRLSLPEPAKSGLGWVGEVLHVDRFGNLITNLPPGALPRTGGVRLRLRSRGFRRLAVVSHYAELPPGGLGALVSSFGLVEIGRREQSAARALSLGAGDRFELAPIAERKARSPRGRK